MILPVLASLLGLVDMVTSVLLQRTGEYQEVGLPALVFGAHPKVWQFAVGYVAITAVLWGVYLGVTRLVVWPWLAVEAYEVQRNLRFLRA